jgi:hypothetical protein
MAALGVPDAGEQGVRARQQSGSGTGRDQTTVALIAAVTTAAVSPKSAGCRLIQRSRSSSWSSDAIDACRAAGCPPRAHAGWRGERGGGDRGVFPAAAPCPPMTASMISVEVAPAKGRTPKSASWSATQKLNWSPRASVTSPRCCSGAM